MLLVRVTSELQIYIRIGDAEGQYVEAWLDPETAESLVSGVQQMLEKLKQHKKD